MTKAFGIVTRRRMGGMGLALILLLIGAALGPLPAAKANTLCVNPGGTGGCFGTITEALVVATDGDTIRIAGGAPYLERLTLTQSISLVGDDPATTIIDGSAAGQVIRITTAVSATLTNLTIRNGQAGASSASDQYGGGIHNLYGHLTLNNVIVTGNHTGADMFGSGDGGGISNDQGQLILYNSLVSGNSTSAALDVAVGSAGYAGYGGGISNANGWLVLDHSTVEGNNTGQGGAGPVNGGQGGSGGGIYSAAGHLILIASTVRDNLAGSGGSGGSSDGNGGSGGGIGGNHLGMEITSSTLSGNQTGQGGPTNGSSGRGGGLYLVNGDPPVFTVVISNSTFSGNTTGLSLPGRTGGDGGAIYTSGNTLILTNDTLAYNDADPGQTGGGLANAGGDVSLKNTLLAHNTVGANRDAIYDCEGQFTSLGYNAIMEPGFCTINSTNGDQYYLGGQIVDPLADNGGPTPTNALPPGSPAIDAADNHACPPTDQRGFKRPVFGGLALRCDVGAFELYRFAVNLPLVRR